MFVKKVRTQEDVDNRDINGFFTIDDYNRITQGIQECYSLANILLLLVTNYTPTLVNITTDITVNLFNNNLIVPLNSMIQVLNQKVFVDSERLTVVQTFTGGYYGTNPNYQNINEIEEKLEKCCMYINRLYFTTSFASEDYSGDLLTSSHII